MKKVLIIALVFSTFFSFTSVFAGQFGAPQPVANENNFAMGVGYFFSQNRWEPSNNSTGNDFKMKRNEVYVQASAATKYVEGYVRVGGTDMKLEDAYGPGQDFKDSSEIFGTVGARAAYPVAPNFAIGPFIQASLYNGFTDYVNGSKVKFNDLWELSLGIAAQVTIDRVVLYAGPYLFWSQTNLENGGPTWEAKNNFGGMVGARLKVTRNFSVEIEGQYNNELSAGGFLCWSF
jgi:hypothetical protein